MNASSKVITPEMLSDTSPLPLQLTPAAVQDFRACAYRFARTYVEHLPLRNPAPPRFVVVDRVVHEAIGEFFRAGGWARVDEEELVRQLMARTGFTSRSRRRGDAAIARQAEALLRAFYRTPYPAHVERELAHGRTLSWRRFRKGLLPSAIADRICLLSDGTIEAIDYRTTDTDLLLASDTWALVMRSLIADAFEGVSDIRVTVIPIESMQPISMDFDPRTFDTGWAGLRQSADEIREGIRHIIDGESVASTFPATPGVHCADCPLRRMCEHRQAAEAVA